MNSPPSYRYSKRQVTKRPAFVAKIPSRPVTSETSVQTTPLQDDTAQSSGDYQTLHKKAFQAKATPNNLILAGPKTSTPKLDKDRPARRVYGNVSPVLRALSETPLKSRNRTTTPTLTSFVKAVGRGNVGEINLPENTASESQLQLSNKTRLIESSEKITSDSSHHSSQEKHKQDVSISHYTRSQAKKKATIDRSYTNKSHAESRTILKIDGKSDSIRNSQFEKNNMSLTDDEILEIASSITKKFRDQSNVSRGKSKASRMRDGSIVAQKEQGLSNVVAPGAEYEQSINPSRRNTRSTASSTNHLSVSKNRDKTIEFRSEVNKEITVVDSRVSIVDKLLETEQSTEDNNNDIIFRKSYDNIATSKSVPATISTNEVNKQVDIKRTSASKVATMSEFEHVPARDAKRKISSRNQREMSNVISDKTPMHESEGEILHNDQHAKTAKIASMSRPRQSSNKPSGYYKEMTSAKIVKDLIAQSETINSQESQKSLKTLYPNMVVSKKGKKRKITDEDSVTRIDLVEGEQPTYSRNATIQSSSPLTVNSFSRNKYKRQPRQQDNIEIDVEDIQDTVTNQPESARAVASETVNLLDENRQIPSSANNDHRSKTQSKFGNSVPAEKQTKVLNLSTSLIKRYEVRGRNKADGFYKEQTYRQVMRTLKAQSENKRQNISSRRVIDDNDIDSQDSVVEASPQFKLPRKKRPARTLAQQEPTEVDNDMELDLFQPPGMKKRKLTSVLPLDIMLQRVEDIAVDYKNNCEEKSHKKAIKNLFRSFHMRMTDMIEKCVLLKNKKAILSKQNKEIHEQINERMREAKEARDVRMEKALRKMASQEQP